MRKHLIIHGDAESGKTLFIKALLNNKSYHRVKCRDPKILDRNIFYNYGTEEKDLLIFEDVHHKIEIEKFYSLTGTIKVLPQFAHPFDINPRLIIEYSQEMEFPIGASFTRRFDVINTNTISYKELIEFLKKWNNSKS